MIEIDGSVGEGGGQILRTSLSLSALTHTPVHLRNIRSKRRTTGLLRQHLTAVRAAAQVCNANVDGAKLSSAEIVFSPGQISGGDYNFAVGSAGSACLVAQTVLPLLLAADGPSTATFEGGTHNPFAPTYDFLDRIFLPALRHMGATVESEIHNHGFYPAGGGSFTLHVTPANLTAFDWQQAGRVRRISAYATLAKLPSHIAERELRVVRTKLSVAARDCHEVQASSPGPGNVLAILVERDLPELITVFGERGKKSERVAHDAVALAKRFVEANVPVGHHLADQLLLPMVIAGGGVFRTGRLDPHVTTNIGVIEMFLDVKFRVTADDGNDGNTVIELIA